MPNLVSLSAAEGFQKESVQQLEFKKRNYFQRKTNPSFIRSGHNPSLLQLWTQLQSFPLVRQKGITFFFTTKTIKLSVRDIQGVFYSSALKKTKYKEEIKYPNFSANCSSKKIPRIRKKQNVGTVPPKRVQSIFTKKFKHLICSYCTLTFF